MNQGIKIWDIAIRTFHWSLVICFFIAYVSGDEDNLLHIYSSYIILGLLGFRVVWGFIGTKYARFSNFIYGLKTGLQYLKSIILGHPQYYLGHNPVGGWMIILLLVFISMTSWTGLELYAREGKGPLASVEASLIATAQANGQKKENDDDEHHDRENEQGHEEWLEELHEGLAEFTLLLVFIHIGGVLVASWLHRENLTKSMWTGYKTPPDELER
ncbi:MAG: cytochrome b/b6 domain-containing protein [Gammaproteobacteria bacterium]|nr:cytochrome b/b6 domain-containing protein [Gammaproteobacteria bacterium]